MKKIIIVIIVVVVGFIVINKVDAKIPDEAIRIRIIPNSNSEVDQEMKGKIKQYLELKMYNLLKDTKGISDARKSINNELPSIDEYINQLFTSNNYNMKYSIDFGLNYFPEKEYKGIKYDEGYYESLVVTIGEGAGDNWWCVLFPPLCLLEAEESDETEYKFFVQELIEKYL